MKPVKGDNGGEAGRSIVRLAETYPGGVTKLKVNWSMASACAVKGRVKAEARRVRVKRALRIVGFPSFNLGFRMRPSGGGVKVREFGVTRIQGFELRSDGHSIDDESPSPLPIFPKIRQFSGILAVALV
jgi:hypothetical protein